MNAARWITPPSAPTENITFLARRSFELCADNLVSPRLLRVAADWRYALSVNGEFVGNGPARGSHRRYFYDSYDVSPFLCVGKNVIAVEVHSPGRATFSAVPVTPALWLDLDGLIATDSDWQVRLDPSCRSEAPAYTPQIGFSDYRDLRVELIDWKTTGAVTSGWTAPRVLEGTPGGRELVASDCPPLTREHHVPAVLISGGAVPAVEENESDNRFFADRMQAERHEESSNAATWKDGVLQLNPTSTGSAYAILDFAQETFGSVLLEVEAPEGTILDLGYGDALYDERVKTYAEPYRVADRYILREGRQRIEHRLHDRGFRYLQIVARGLSRSVVLHSIVVEQRAYPLPVRATFACDDPFLNRLWAMGDRTLAICATDTFIDCPWREQALWLNDTLVVYPLYLAFTGDATLPSRCLRLATDGQRDNGLIPSVYPAAEGHNTAFPSMPAIYTLMLADYYLYTGDGALVSELLPAVDRALAVYETWAQPDGLVPDQNDLWNFIDWTSPGSRDQWSAVGSHGEVATGRVTTILNMLIVAAYQSASTLHLASGNSARAAILQQKQTRLLDALIDRFWNAGSGRFCDGTAHPHSSSQHPQAVGLHYGLFDDAHRAAALTALLDDEVIRTDFYFQYFVLNALSLGGHGAEALAVIRRMWGPMVEAGSPTIWETTLGKEEFNGAGSLCHAFACAPLYFMQATLLGVRPLQPGFREFSLTPQSLGLTSACGTIPTPHGLISIEWHRQPDGSLRGVIDVPPSTTAVCADGSRLDTGSHVFQFVPVPTLH